VDRHAVSCSGIRARQPAALDALKKYCSTVIVDLERSQNVEPAPVLRIAYPQKVPVEWIPAGARRAQESRVLMREVIAAARIGRTSTPSASRRGHQHDRERAAHPDALLLFAAAAARKANTTESHAIDVRSIDHFGRFLQLDADRSSSRLPRPVAGRRKVRLPKEPSPIAT